MTRSMETTISFERLKCPKTLSGNHLFELCPCETCRANEVPPVCRYCGMVNDVDFEYELLN